jgi:hypothetical protein
VLTSPQDHWLIKGQEFEKWIEKGEKKNFGPIRGGEIKKKFVFETKSFHKTRVRVV